MDSVASLRTQDTVSRIWYGAVPKREYTSEAMER